jgi:hypothetical protein
MTRRSQCLRSPVGTWGAVAVFLTATPFSGRRRWHHVPVRANGQLAFDLTQRAGVARGRYLADAIMVLGLDSSAGIASVTAFREQAAFARFGLPDQIAR